MSANSLGGTFEQTSSDDDSSIAISLHPAPGWSPSLLVPLTFYRLHRLAMFDIVSVCRLGPWVTGARAV